MAQKPLALPWGELKTLFLSGVTLQELANRYSVSVNTLRSRSAREKWAFVPERFKATMAIPTEKSAPIVTDIWQERRNSFRELEHKIAEKVTRYASELSEDQQLAKIDKIEIAAKMGRRATGLDKEECNPNAINIAILSTPFGSLSKSRVYESNSDCIEAFPDS